MRDRLSKEELRDGILSGDKIILSRAISLAESTLGSDQELFSLLLKEIYPHTGKSLRIAVTGTPGAGKSTLIESLGKKLVGQGKKIAVITIDPSSSISGGSILGDKTRMTELSKHPYAYIRPASNGQALGGISDSTREIVFLCEAAGYDLLFIETVGVGQSETEVSELTDLFLLVLNPGGGDDLQAIKKGIMEMPDAVIINKSESSNKNLSDKLASDIKAGFHFTNNKKSSIFQVSALLNIRIDELVAYIIAHSGKPDLNKRKQQNISWLYQQLKKRLWQDFLEDKSVRIKLAEMENEIKEGTILPSEVTGKLLQIFKGK